MTGLVVAGGMIAMLGCGGQEVRTDAELTQEQAQQKTQRYQQMQQLVHGSSDQQQNQQQ